MQWATTEDEHLPEKVPEALSLGAPEREVHAALVCVTSQGREGAELLVIAPLEENNEIRVLVVATRHAGRARHTTVSDTRHTRSLIFPRSANLYGPR